MQTRTLENFQAGAGNAQALLAQSGRQAQGIAANIPIQNFNVRLMELLKQYQTLGIKPFAEQAFGAQEAQARRVFNTPQELIGASPALQSQVRSADVSAIQPTISAAQQSQRTFAEQIGGLGDAISRAQNLVQSFEQQRRDEKSEAQNIINFALTSGGSAGLEALLKAQPNIVKMSGFDETTIQGLIPTFKKKEEEAAALKKQTQTVDLGDRVAILDMQGNVLRYETKGVKPGEGIGGTITPEQRATFKFETLDDIRQLPVSELTKSVIAGIGKVKDLSPTDKAKVQSELFAVGFNPYEYVNRKLDALSVTWASVPEKYKGLIQGIPARFTGKVEPKVSEFESTKTVLTREIARLFDVGVLSDQDVASYRAALPDLSDRNIDVVNAKIRGVKSSLSSGIAPSKATGQFIVVAPNGKRYTFPTQQAADQFKQRSGIK